MCISQMKVRLHIDRPSISKLYGYVVEIAKPLIRIGSEEEERCTHTRYHSRYFVQIGHETTYASSGNKHFFTK